MMQCRARQSKAYTTGNSIRKTTTSIPYNAGASSLNRIPLHYNGFVEFLMTNTEPQDEKFYIGLTERDTGSAHNPP